MRDCKLKNESLKRKCSVACSVADEVWFDPHRADGADNSYYQRTTQRLAFGQGSVNNAECADVIVHKLGHALHNWLTHGGLSQTEGLSKGFGDYLALSYSRSLINWTPADDEWNWIFG